MRRAAKVDGNQPEIVKALRAVGATVRDLSGVGQGCPDLLVGYRGRNVLIEVKDPSQPPNKRKLTPDQAEFHALWRGQVIVVESPEAAIAALVE